MTTTKRFQFSLATLLVCMTLLGVVCAVAISMPIMHRSTAASEGGLYANPECSAMFSVVQ